MLVRFKHIISIIIVFALLISAKPSSQQYSQEELMATYLIVLTKHITWEDQDDLKTFKVGILARDAKIYNSLSKIVKSKKLTVKGKEFEIYHFNSLQNIYKTQMLYVGPTYKNNLDQIKSKIASRNVLYVTDGNDISKSMINFNRKSKKAFELNEQNILTAGLTMSSKLANFSSKKTDWQTMYQKQEKELKSEKEKVKVKDLALKEKERLLDEQTLILDKQSRKIETQFKNLEHQKIDMIQNKNKITSQNKEIIEREKRMTQQDTILRRQQGALDKQKSIDRLKTIVFLVILLAGAGMAFFIYRAYRVQKLSTQGLQDKNEEILSQNEEILQQKEELITQSEMLTKTNSELEKYMEEIESSIGYAKKIQQSIMPSISTCNNYTKDAFIYLNPKFDVSGDFYWLAGINDLLFVAAVDCTGHGIPGAFMSMIGNTLLNEIVKDKKVHYPSEILDKLHDGIIAALKQHQDGVEQLDDGMDISLCCFNKKTNELTLSCANHHPFIISGKEIRDIEGDYFSIGGGIFSKQPDQHFASKTIKIKPNDTLYMFSDGYQDQFGGPDYRKFMITRFKKMVTDNQHLSMKDQQKLLDSELTSWKGYGKQIDDILVIGLRF